MNDRISVLWISSNPPIKDSKHAGGQTFNYYFNRIKEDTLFDVKLIALCKQSQREDALKYNDNVDTFFVFNQSASKIQKISNLESKFNPWNKHAGLISNYCVKEIIKHCKRLKKDGYEPDVIILEWTSSVVIAKEVKTVFSNSKIIASEHDVTFVGYERKKEYYKNPIWKISANNEKKVELNALKECDLVLPHNADNKEILIKNGIDKDSVLGLVPYYHNMSSIDRTPNRKDILYFGAMNREENILSAEWFIDRVMPKLENRDIKFVILGSNPPDSLKSKESERIVVTGFVDSIDPYFEKSMCLVAPIVLGAGIKVKIMEALSSGIPVLTNELGIEGIPAENGKEYFHCETPEEYIDVIVKILDNRIDEKEISNNAKQFMTKTFSPERFLEEYKDRIKRMVQ